MFKGFEDVTGTHFFYTMFYLLRHTTKFWWRNWSWKRDSDIMMTLDLVLWLWLYLVLAQVSRLMTKPTKWHARPAKTQISLGIRPVWSESSLCAQWLAKGPSFLRAAKSPISLGGCPGWSETSLVAHATLLVLSSYGSNNMSVLPSCDIQPQVLVEELIILSASTHVDDSFVHKVRKIVILKWSLFWPNSAI